MKKQIQISQVYKNNVKLNKVKKIKELTVNTTTTTTTKTKYKTNTSNKRQFQKTKKQKMISVTTNLIRVFLISQIQFTVVDFRSSRPEMLCKKCLKNLAKLKGKRLCRSLFSTEFYEYLKTETIRG